MAGGVLAELDLDALLQRIVEAARELTGARYAALSVLADDRRGLSRFVTAGLDDEAHRRIGEHPRGRGLLGEIVVLGEVVRLSDLGAHPRAYGFPAGHPAMRSFLGVPIVVGGTPFGNLYLTERADGDFDSGDEEAARALADWAGIAIHNAQRYRELEARREELERERAERLRQRIDAAEEERRRWARELHDETLQRLVALRLRLALGLRDAASGALGEAVARALVEVDAEINELRRLIGELRPAPLATLGLPRAIRALADHTSELSGIALEASVTLTAPGGEAISLPAETERAVYRLVQEALSNVERHAAAERARVSVSAVDDEIRIEVEDDGAGFDPAGVEQGFGLEGMVERVELLGGRIEIDSAPGQGTRLRAIVPL